MLAVRPGLMGALVLAIAGEQSACREYPGAIMPSQLRHYNGLAEWDRHPVASSQATFTRLAAAAMKSRI